MTSVSLGLSSQANAMRNLSVPPVTSTVPPLIRPRVPGLTSGAVGRMVATTKTGGGGGGRSFGLEGGGQCGSEGDGGGGAADLLEELAACGGTAEDEQIINVSGGTGDAVVGMGIAHKPGEYGLLGGRWL